MSLGVVFAILLPVVLLLNVLVFRVSTRRGRARRERAIAETGWSKVAMNAWVRESVRTVFPFAIPEAVTVGTVHGREIFVVDCMHVRYGMTLGRGARFKKQPHTAHVVLLPLPVELPPIVVSKQYLVNHRPNEWRSGNPAFDERFDVQSSDRNYASALLAPGLVDWILRNPALQWRISGNALIGWNEYRWTPAGATGMANALRGVADAIPAQVLQSYGRPAPPISASAGW
ncbi:hypothetical protein HPO96_14960 [Kribbella sandramycini]|uniref:Uncharacterized protein n=1 Tax=Kribbella sandramycini TaxID=60450 RepID=A0A7Y4KZI9_9ACTN|nr:hypothetical protein [Kribbella sandramycini]MBB6565276.1 hypothetical protein [Kribbella sandramycini]NOL41545.1 hypothetical protein [Kribbella sandramycini]